MFLYLIEFLVTTLLIVFVLTQITLPAFFDRPLFPLFRRERVKLERELAEAHEEQDLAEMEAEVKTAKERVGLRRKPKEARFISLEEEVEKRRAKK